MTEPLREGREGPIIDLRVQPKASRLQVGPVADGRLKVAVTAPPDKGKANKAVVKLLAKKLRTAPSNLEVVSGHTGRNKAVQVCGLSLAEVRTRLELGK